MSSDEFVDSSIVSYFDFIRMLTNVHNEHDKLLQRKLGIKFSVFDYIDVDENKLSDIVRDLLDPNGAHGQGSIFWNLFTEIIDQQDILSPARVLREVFTDVIARGRFIDILAYDHDEKNVFIIENKPWATEQDNQLADYEMWVKKRFKNARVKVIFLDGLGKKPETQLPDSDPIIVPYFTAKDSTSPSCSIYSWINNCVRFCESENVTCFLKDFSWYIFHNFSNEVFMNSTHTDMISIVTRFATDNNNLDNLKLALAVGDARNDICKVVIDRFCSDLHGCLLEILVDKKIDTNGLAFEPWDTSEIDSKYNGIMVRYKEWGNTIGIGFESVTCANNIVFGVVACNDKAFLHQVKHSGLDPKLETPVHNEVRDYIYRMANELHLGSPRSSDFWAWFIALKDPLKSWKTTDALLLLSGSVKYRDGYTAVEFFAEKISSLVRIVNIALEEHHGVFVLTSQCRWARVLCHPQIVEHQAHVAG